MSKPRRPLEEYEKRECAQFKAAFNAWNAARPKPERVTQEQVAAHLGMNQGSFSNYLNGHRPLNADVAIGVYELTGIPVSAYSERLSSEIDRAAQVSSLQKQQGSKESNVINADFSITRKDMVDIPRLEVSASMGGGLARPEDYEDVIDKMRVSTGWLRKNVNATNHANLAVITGYGDSMEGTFSDGDMLLVDRGITEIRIDAVYVLALRGELYIKRIQRRPDGVYLMISDNEKYKPFEIKNGDLAEFEVLGRVLLAWNANRL